MGLEIMVASKCYLLDEGGDNYIFRLELYSGNDLHLFVDDSEQAKNKCSSIMAKIPKSDFIGNFCDFMDEVKIGIVQNFNQMKESLIQQEASKQDIENMLTSIAAKYKDKDKDIGL